MSICDVEFATAKPPSYRGIARISLSALSFSHRLFQEKHRQESAKNTTRLVRIFERSGCRRLEEGNFIDATVEKNDLDAALASVGMITSQLRSLQWAQDAPHLPLHNLLCISGLHRVKAAQEFLPENDKWWIVRLWASGIITCSLITNFS